MSLSNSLSCYSQSGFGGNLSKEPSAPKGVPISPGGAAQGTLSQQDPAWRSLLIGYSICCQNLK